MSKRTIAESHEGAAPRSALAFFRFCLRAEQVPAPKVWRRHVQTFAKSAPRGGGNTFEFRATGGGRFQRLGRSRGASDASVAFARETPSVSRKIPGPVA
jgi:hypothetical protein